MNSLADLEEPTAFVGVSARLRAPVEWWFVHGRFNAAADGEHAFMVSVFTAARYPQETDAPPTAIPR